VEYVDNKPAHRTVVISTQYSPEVSTEDLRAEVQKHIIDTVVPADMVDEFLLYHINPTGGLWWAARTAIRGIDGP
jgi:S-adenosylmethionine synthetase